MICGICKAETTLPYGKCANYDQPWHEDMESCLAAQVEQIVANKKAHQIGADTSDPERYYISTASGRRVYLDDPRDFFIQDIANALSNTCRWGGQLNTFWSVAQHSIVLYHLMPTHLKKAALLHDAAEAYIGDWPRPLLRHIGGEIIKLKALVEQRIEEQFQFFSDAPELKCWDDQIIHVEAWVFGLKKHPACQNPRNLSDPEFTHAIHLIHSLMGEPPTRIRELFLSLVCE